MTPAPDPTGASSSNPRIVFDAFISYSHRADTDLAPSLRAALHRLAKPWYRARAVRVFLDEAAMSAEPALWPGIVRALDASRTFVLLLSPESAASVWVGREVSHWLERHGTASMLLVLTAGEIAWDSGTGDFDPEASTAIPPPLRGVFEHEPRHVDMRWAEGRADLTLRDPRFRDATAEIAAPIRGMSKDDLVGSDLREHQRVLRITRAVTGLLSVLLIASVLAGVSARRNATRAEQRRVDAQSVRLRSESIATRVTTDTTFLLAAQAYRMRATDENRAALVRALQRTPDLRRYLRGDGARIIGVAVSDTGREVVSYDTDGKLVAWDPATGRRLASSTGERRGSSLGAAAGGVLVVGLSSVELRDWRTLEVRSRWSAGSTIVSGAVALGDGSVLIARADGSVATAAHGDRDPAWTNVDPSLASTYALDRSADGAVLVGAGPDGTVRVVRIDAAPGRAPVARWSVPVTRATGSVTTVPGDGTVPTVVVITSDGSCVLLSDTDGSTIDRIGVTTSAITDAASSPANPKYVLLATGDGEYLYVEPTRRVSFTGEPVHSGPVTAIAWSPSGIAATSGADGVVTVLDTQSNRIDTGAPLDISPLAIDLGDDGRTLTWLEPDGTARSATLRTDGSLDADRALGTLKDGLAVIGTRHGVVAADRAGRVTLLGTGGEATPAEMTGASPVTALRRMAGDRVVGLRGNGLLQVWRVRPGGLELDRTVSDRASAFSTQGADGTLIAYFEVGAGLVVADAIDGSERLRVERTQQPQTAIALRPDGTQVAIADGAEVDVLAIGRAAPQIRLEALTDVVGASFVDGGRRIVTVDGVGGLTLLDTVSRARLGRLVEEEGLTFRAMAVGTGSDTVVVTHLTPAGLRAQVRSFDPARALAEGCALFGRAFTDGERRRFDLDASDAPCERLPEPGSSAMGLAASARAATTPRTPDTPDEELTQQAASAALAKGSGVPDELAACVRAVLNRTPWALVDSIVVARDRNGSAELAARLGPTVRYCREQDGDPKQEPEGFGQVPLQRADLEARWNAAAAEAGSPAFTSMQGTWTDMRGADGQGGWLRSVGPNATLLAFEAPDGSGRLISVSLTLRPPPAGAVAQTGAEILVETVQARLRAPAVVGAVDLDRAIRTPTRQFASVGEAIYGLTSSTDGGGSGTPSVVQLVVSLAI
jgi:WD40 repeat protein